MGVFLAAVNSKGRCMNILQEMKSGPRRIKILNLPRSFLKSAKNPVSYTLYFQVLNTTTENYDNDNHGRNHCKFDPYLYQIWGRGSTMLKEVVIAISLAWEINRWHYVLSGEINLKVSRGNTFKINAWWRSFNHRNAGAKIASGGIGELCMHHLVSLTVYIYVSMTPYH